MYVQRLLYTIDRPFRVVAFEMLSCASSIPYHLSLGNLLSHVHHEIPFLLLQLKRFGHWKVSK
jgi:hypothetical protein